METRRYPSSAEYVSSVVENARRRNPSLADLDRLAEILPPRRMTYWPYFIREWNVGCDADVGE
jgi:hypothetical protein